VLGVPDLARIHERPDLQALACKNFNLQIDVCRRALSDGFERCKDLYIDFVLSVWGRAMAASSPFKYRPPSASTSAAAAQVS